MNTEKYKFLTLNYIKVMKVIIITFILAPSSIVLATFFLIERNQDQVK
jgi:hypothetical protein